MAAKQRLVLIGIVRLPSIIVTGVSNPMGVRTATVIEPITTAFGFGTIYTECIAIILLIHMPFTVIVLHIYIVGIIPFHQLACSLFFHTTDNSRTYIQTTCFHIDMLTEGMNI
jgi:hypothetical protein